MTITQGGQPVGVIRSSVLLVADPQERDFQQPHDRGQHLRAWQTGTSQVRIEASLQSRQGMGKGDHAVVLGLIADRSPAAVIAVLFTAAGIAAGRLKMAVGTRTDPDVAPGWRQYEGTNARKCLLIADGSAVGADVAEAAAGTHAVDTGRMVADIAEMRRLGGDQGCRRRLRTAFLSGTATPGGSHDGKAPPPG